MCSHLPVDVIEKFILQGLKPNQTFRIKNGVDGFKYDNLLQIAINRKSVLMMQLLNKHNFDFEKYSQKVYLPMCDKGFVNGIKAMHQILEESREKPKNNKQNKDSCYNSVKKLHNPTSHVSWLNSTKLQTDEHGNNALHLAASSQNVELVEYLLDDVYFPNKNLGDTDGLTVINQTNYSKEKPLIFACKYNSHKIMPIVKLLIEYNKNISDYDMWCTMYNGACYNNLFVLKYMFDKKLGIETINSTAIDFNCDYDRYHSTPLMGAIEKHNVEAVEIFCKYDTIDIDTIKSKFQDFTALEFGAYFGNGEILKILLRTLMKSKKVQSLKSFHKCIHLNCLKRLKTIAQQGLKDGKTNLKRKCQSDQCAGLLEYLIENYNNYFEIAIRLRYDVSSTIRNGAVPNYTVLTDFYHKYNRKYNYNSRTLKNKQMQIKRTASANNSKTKGRNCNRVDRWTIHEELGRGAFGRVEKGIDKLQNGMEVALKFISVNKMVQRQNNKKRLKIIELIMNEIDTVHKIDHKNVIKLLAYNLNVDDSGTVLLVFEYAQCGELYRFLAINKYFNDDIAKTYFEQILNALEICHAMGIIHRDIKPQNILLDLKYQIKIADFWFKYI